MKTLHICTAALLLALPLEAAVTVNYGNNISGDTFLRDQSGVPLTSGPKGAGDGAVVQVGYYSMATSADPFAGEWVALVGPGSGVSAATIGDSPTGPVLDGLFAGSALLDAPHPGSVSYPAVGTPLAIRFYDGTSIGSSTSYNAVTAADWGWPGLGSSTDELFLTIVNVGVDGLIWEGGAGSAYRTTVPVPEASTALLGLVATGAYAFGGRRRASAAPARSPQRGCGSDG